MTPGTAAARLSIALRPGATVHPSARAFSALAIYTKFGREVAAEAGPDELDRIVRTVEAHQKITRGAA